MKFFNWMQSKVVHSGHVQAGHKTSNVTTSASHHMKKQEPELNDWPHGLLTIGTFGNNIDLPTTQINEDDTQNNASSTSPDLSEFTPEEIEKLQKELTKLLSKKKQITTASDDQLLPLDRFLNCPSSLEVDRRLSTTVNPEEIDRTIKVILGQCKDICTHVDNKKSIFRKKSISGLLKKMFVCSSGLPPMPSVHDRLPESRMERLLRAMLKNKMGPQNSTRVSSARKMIENRQSAKNGKGKAAQKDNEEDAEEEDGCKWVKTDSEYIVLEI